jgi:hypothetical protein
MKKLLAVAVGFILATLVPLVLGVSVGGSVVIGGAYVLLFLFLCILPLPGTVWGIVLAILMMVLFVPHDPPVSDGLPLHGSSRGDPARSVRCSWLLGMGSTCCVAGPGATGTGEG